MSHYSEFYEHSYLPPRPEYKPKDWSEVLRDLEKGKAGLNVGLLYDVVRLLVVNELISQKLLDPLDTHL